MPITMTTRRRHRSVELLAGFALVLSAGFSPAVNSAPLPDMGDPSESFFSSRQEKQLGEEFMRTVRQTLPLLEDPLVDYYIQSLGKRVAAGLRNYTGELDFFVINNRQINAFAGPGGHIGIHTGLIATARTEDELAAVLAHEIAHVTQRHLAQAFKNTADMSLPMTAAVIAAIILGRDNSQVSQAAIASAAAGSMQTQINFTRENEKEADRIGLDVLATAGFDPRAMPAFFERMQKANRSDESDALEFLRTHPVTPSRIADTRNRAEQYPSSLPPANHRFPLIQARLAVLTAADNEQTLQRFRAALARNDDAVNRYGLALALQQSGQLALALTTLQPLIDSSPDQIDYRCAELEILLAAGNAKQAQSIAAQALTLFPHHPALTLLYARSLVDNGQAELASTVLIEQIRYAGATPRLYARLAQAQEKTGQTAASYLSLAEHYVLLGDLQTAMTHLQTALQHTEADDSNLAIKIRARMKTIAARLNSR